MNYLVKFRKTTIFALHVLENTMTEKRRNYIRINKDGIDAQLDVFIYENDGFQIAYAPALDLMGYGKTVEDAKASFEVVIEDFFDFGIQRKTLDTYLKEHGWTKEAKAVEFKSPQAWIILQRNKQLQEIFSSDFQKQTVPFVHSFAC